MLPRVIPTRHGRASSGSSSHTPPSACARLHHKATSGMSIFPSLKACTLHRQQWRRRQQASTRSAQHAAALEEERQLASMPNSTTRQAGRANRKNTHRRPPYASCCSGRRQLRQQPDVCLLYLGVLGFRVSCVEKIRKRHRRRGRPAPCRSGHGSSGQCRACRRRRSLRPENRNNKMRFRSEGFNPTTSNQRRSRHASCVQVLAGPGIGGPNTTHK